MLLEIGVVVAVPENLTMHDFVKRVRVENNTKE